MPDGEELVYVSPDSTESGEPELRIWRIAKGAFLKISYPDGVQFWFDHKRENLWAEWPDALSVEHAASYLFGPILGLLLRLRGVTCLHASAVAFKGRSIAFVGPAEAGKSTIAAAFAKQGYGVLADDIVALVERGSDFHVLPAYPHLSLWPDSVDILYGSPDALPHFIADWEKRRLDLGVRDTHFENRSLPLGAVYLLGERCSDVATQVKPMTPRGALISLVAETYANRILDREMRAREFEVLGRLVSKVPIRRVCPHRDFCRLEELCRTVRSDIKLLEPQP